MIPAIARLPRVSLGSYPTPLVEAKHLSATLGGPRILIKRDDLTGAALSGTRGDLTGIPTKVVYWFAWQQNHPDTRVWGGGELRDPRAAGLVPQDGQRPRQAPQAAPTQGEEHAS